MSFHCEKFESIDELLKVIESRPNNKVMQYENSSTNGSEGFTGTKSYDYAKELITKGWSEPLEKLKAGTHKNIKTNVTREKALPSNGVVGYVPCVPNAILGLPKSMIKTDRVPSKVKAVTITYGITVNAGWESDTIIKCGITALNIVNDLELAGYRVGLNVEFMASTSGNQTIVATVKVKDWRQPLDIKKVAFPMVHTSMFRRFGFKYLETCPELKHSGYANGYGKPTSNDGYSKQVELYKENGVLGDKDYLITAEMIKGQGFDSEKVMRKAGINLLKK